jgi:sugar lactone lactonase YvrE
MRSVFPRLLVFVIIFTFIPSLIATTFYVDVNGNNGNGLSWGNAKTTLQGAINASSPGDDILVKYGTYNLTFANAITSNRRISSDDGTHSSFDTARPDSSQTIMQGNGTFRILRFTSSNVTNACRLRGLKITGGNASNESYWAGAGGGIMVYDGANPSIENCWITGNYGNTSNSPASGSPGGGMFFKDVNGIVLRNSHISNNVATTDEYYGGSGGGVYIIGSATLQGNIFRNNIAVISAGSQYYGCTGGAILHREGTLSLVGNLIEGNSAISRSVSYDSAPWGAMASAGGVDMDVSSVGVVRNNIFLNNITFLTPNQNNYAGQGSTAGAGALTTSTANVIVENNTFIGNQARSQTAYQITPTVAAATFHSSNTLRNNIFKDNTDWGTTAVTSFPSPMSISYNCFNGNSANYPDTWTSTAEVLTDPQLVNIAARDFSLQSASPCIDAGDPDTDTTGFILDFSGDYRLRNGRVDMGALEYQFGGRPEITSPSSASATEDQSFSYQLTGLDPENGPLRFELRWLPTWLSFDGVDLLTGMPLNGDQDSSFHAVLTADGGVDSLIVQVSVTAVNDLPVITPIDPQEIEANESLSDLAFQISDEETPVNELDLSITSSNTDLIPLENLIVSGTDGDLLLSITPLEDESGVSEILIEVSNDVQTVQQRFLVTVNPPNQPPEFSGEPLLAATEDEAYAFEFNVSDAEGDEVSLESELPGWLTLGQSQERIISTYAGIVTPGFNGNDIPAATAAITGPQGMFVANDGTLYFTEGSHRMRKITPEGIIQAVAGIGIFGTAADGNLAINSRISNPSCVTVDAFGNVYFAEASGTKIRKIDANGVLSTFAGNGSYGFSGDGGLATQAGLYGVRAMAFDPQGNMYLTDSNNSRIRKIDTSGIITTIAGTGQWGFSGDGGPAVSADLSGPWGLSISPQGEIFFSDYGNHRIRKIDLDGYVTTVAGSSAGFSGDGASAIQAQLYYPQGLTAGSDGLLYIADTRNNRIRVVTPEGIIQTLAGTGPAYGSMGSFSGDGGPADAAGLWEPYDVVLDPTGPNYVADNRNHRIRKVAVPMMQLSGIPGNDDVGSNPVTLIASDGEDSSSLNFTIEVTGVNDPPQIVSSPDIQAMEDEYLVVTPQAVDVDTDLLTWTVAGLPQWLTFAGDSLFGTPLFGHQDTSVTLMVSDGEFADTLLLAIQVIQVNDSPQITAPSLILALEERTFDYLLTATDEENDAISFSFDNLPDWMTVFADTLRGAAPEGVLSASFSILASDGNSSDSLDVDIQVEPLNDIPELILALGEVSLDEDQQGGVLISDLTQHFQDVDAGDHLRFTPTLMDVGMDSVLISSINDLPALVGYPAQDFNGVIRVLVEAIDDSLAFVTDTLTVHVLPVNDPPQFSAIPDTSFDEDTFLRIPLMELMAYVEDTEDPDSSLTWIESYELDHLGYSIVDQAILVIADLNWFGTENITIYVSDSGGLRDTATVTIHVLPVNDAPQPFGLIAPAHNSVISEPDSTELTFAWEPSSDIEDDPLLYELLFYTSSWDSSIADISTTSYRFNIESLPRGEDITWTCTVYDAEDSTGSGESALFTVSPLVGIHSAPALPEDYVLEQNYPNPFNPLTHIKFGLPEMSDVELIIYDVRGRVIYRWTHLSAPAGWYEAHWMGQTTQGECVPTGVYFCRMQAGTYSSVKKMLFLK